MNMGIPLSSRIKEIERQDSDIAPNIITNYDEIRNEIYYLFEQSKKELLIFSSTKLMHDIMTCRSNLFNYFLLLSSRDISTKILVDNFDESLMNTIDISNNKSKSNNNNPPILLRYSNRLGNFNEMVIMSDSKHLFQIKYNQIGNLEALYSNEKHQIFIQEILFEKFWNEVESLSDVTNNM